MYEHNALGYWSGLTLCLTKVRSSRARCPATALIFSINSKSEGCHEMAAETGVERGRIRLYHKRALIM